MTREIDARKVLFFRALHQADTNGLFMGKSEFKSLAETVSVDENLSREERVLFLCDRLEERLGRRHEIDFGTYYRGFRPISFGWVVVLTVLFGLASNYLGGSGRVNLLLNSFMVLLFWNLAIYGSLAVNTLPLLSKRRDTEPVLGTLWRRLISKTSLLGHGNRAKFVVLSEARALFYKYWYREYGPLSRNRLMGRFHLLAALFSVGITAGLYLRGLAKEYGFFWSSTFIRDPETMKSLLEILFWPVLLVRRGWFSDGLPALAGNNGAEWIHLFAVAGFLYIVLPRSVLAIVAYRRGVSMLRRLKLDLDRPFIFELSAPFERDRRQISVWTYSYTLPEEKQQNLASAAKKIWGAKSTIGPTNAVAWGSLPEIPEDADDRDNLHLVCFNGIQTPEDEMHGAFLEDFQKKLSGDNKTASVLLLVDHEKVDVEKKAQRENAWRRVVEKVGPPYQIAWVNLAAVPGDDLLKELSARVRSVPV